MTLSRRCLNQARFLVKRCPPCRVEAAYLEQNWRKYKDQGVPETFFIAKNGELRGMQIGPLVSPQLENKIEALLAEPYPDY